MKFLNRCLKRLTDILLAIIALMIFVLPMLIFCLMVAVKLGRPIIFTQTRPGIYGKPFRMFKFRTMTNECDLNGVLLPDSQRLKAFGNWLRSSSLDELPELLNVLKGEMSLVGPRPLLMEYLPLYSPEQARRHEMRPGITGWAQVNGRNAISWEQKFKLDVWYVDHHNIYLDIKILFMTVQKVFKRDGIYSEGQVTMSKFTGSKS